MTKAHDFIDYKAARDLLRPFKLKSFGEYLNLRNSNADIRRVCPAKPQNYYNEWVSVYDFLSITKTNLKEQELVVDGKRYVSYSKVLAFIKDREIGSKAGWLAIVKPKGFPDDLNVYKGHGFRSYKYLFKDHQPADRWAPYETAKGIVRARGINTQREYDEEKKAGILPKTLPSSPHIVYRAQWEGWELFLGQKKRMATYQECCEIVRGAQIKTVQEYLELVSSFKGDVRLPSKPDKQYREFVSYAVMFGASTKNASMSSEKSLALLRRLEDRLGVSLSDLNDSEFLFLLNSTPEGKAMLLYNMTLERVLDIKHSMKGSPFDMSAGFPETFGNILAYLGQNNLNVIGSEDQSLLELFNNIVMARCIQDGAYRESVKRAGTSELAHVAKVVEAVEAMPGLTEEQAAALGVEDLNFMQKYCGWFLKQNNRLGNWSGTGAGKTLSAAYAAYVGHCKRVLVLTASQVISGWIKTLRAFREDVVESKMDLEKPNAWANVVNYEKIQTYNRVARVKNLVGHQYDMIIFDESHLFKASQGKSSFRRESIEQLLKGYNGKFMLLSATPFVNNLKEALSAIKLISPSTNLSKQPVARNLIEYHRMFTKLGVRYVPKLPMILDEQFVDVKLPHGTYKRIGSKAGYTIHWVERSLLPYKKKALLGLLKKGTVVYTYYVKGILDELKSAIAGEGWSIGVYTGEEKSGLEAFIEGGRDILISSKALSLGYDGLQRRVDRVVIVCPMWTSTEYDQFVGRFHRQGSKHARIEVFKIRLIEEGHPWKANWDVLRWEKIESKRDLLKCVLDGRIPEELEFDRKKIIKMYKQKVLDER